MWALDPRCAAGSFMLVTAAPRAEAQSLGTGVMQANLPQATSEPGVAAGVVTVSLLPRPQGCGSLRMGPQNFGDLAHGAEACHHDSQGG